MVPSSPYVPCRTGNTTSKPPAVRTSAEMAAGFPSDSSFLIVSLGARAFMGFPEESQRPSWVMPMGTTSYFCGSKDCRTDSADRSDTSCSPERPPNRTAIRILAGVFMFPHNLRNGFNSSIDRDSIQFKMRHHSNTNVIHGKNKNISFPELGNEFRRLHSGFLEAEDHDIGLDLIW